MQEITADILRKTASHIRQLTTDNERLKSENDEFKKTAEAKDLVVKMLLNGELDPEDYETKVAEFKEGDLDVIKTAMSHFGGQHVDFGQVEDEEEKLAAVGGDLDPLTQYLYGLDR